MKTTNPSLELYARQWGATAVPFSELNQTAWIQTPQTQRAHDLLMQTAVLKGVMLLAGPNGVGKSVLAGRWLQQLDNRIFHPLVLTHATLTGSSVLAALTLKLGKPAAHRRERNLQLIEESLAELERKHLVVVLDEAQNYSQGALEEIRLLLGLNLPDQPAFSLILVADDYLLGTLRLRHHRALYSRISCHHQLKPWTAAEVALYLEKNLAAVGINREVFDPPALELLTSASGGLARSLCLLARASWIHAASQNSTTVAAAHVQNALEQVPYAPGLQPSLPTT
jgi:type II secretory pathway predicted ATPase ExeA